MPAVEIKESEEGSITMSATEYTGCSLCAISGTYGLVQNNSYAQVLQKQFEEHLAKKGISGGYRGAYVQGAICTVSEWYPDWMKQEKWLLEHGFKLLGVYPGAHPDLYHGSYKNRLYGSKEFELPKQENK